MSDVTVDTYMGMLQEAFPCTLVASSRDRGWERATVLRWEQQGRFEGAIDPFAFHFLELHLSGHQATRYDLGSGRMRVFGGRPGDLIFFPAGVRSVQDNDMGCGVLQVLLEDRAVLEAAAEMGLPPTALEPVVGFRDAEVERLARLMLREVRGDAPGGRLMADALALALTVALFRAMGPATRPGRHTGGLSPAMVRRMRDYMAANLGRPVGLDELAALAGLSRFHFCRAFKQSTGMPPHAYHLALRLERARHLLADPAVPVSEVAAATGFASQAHLTAVFRRHLGTTPGAYRQELA